LIKAKACDVFNIQVSKCGGLISSRRLALAAREAGLGVQIGAHIGETSILSAAGRHLAAHLPEVDSLEGSLGTHLFTEDIALEPVMFGYGGQADLLIGDGLGLEIDDAALERLASEVITVKV
jgi:muconate cycloisomerase